MRKHHRLPRGIAAAVLLALAGSGCVVYRAPFKPPAGWLVTQVTVPATTRFADTPVGTAKGSTASFYFHEPVFTGANFAWSDCSIGKAARKGKLTTVHYADYEFIQFLGVFGRMAVTAYGESAP